MCGILGVYNLKGPEVDIESTKLMGEELKHRGPDSEGTYFDYNIGLYHKRLAILDTSENGKQPMHSKDGNWVITFNGCIYNFKELREELISSGHDFKSGSDTEVIAEGISTYGIEYFKRFNGMFAIGCLLYTSPSPRD